MVFAILYAIILPFAIDHSGPRGEFGDSFGALTALFNALSLAALITTVILQRTEMHDAATAVTKQLDQQKQYENLRLLPVMKAEWFSLSHEDGGGGIHQFLLRIRNVGPGPAIVDDVQLPGSRDVFDTNLTVSREQRQQLWERTINRALQEAGQSNNGVKSIEIDQLDNSNRALGPGEPQRYLRVGFKVSIPPDVAHGILQSRAVPVVHFSSLVGDRYDSETQFESIKALNQK